MRIAKHKYKSHNPLFRLNRFEHFNAKRNRNYRLHQQIRRREGLEIFEGRKPDIMHIIEAPQLGPKPNYATLIDERTPKIEIVKDNVYEIPDVVVGVIKD